MKTYRISFAYHRCVLNEVPATHVVRGVLKDLMTVLRRALTFTERSLMVD